MSEQNHRFNYGQEELSYSIQYSDRTTLDISVYPDMSILVTAPQDADLEKVQTRVKRKARWIVKQVNYFKQFNPRITPRQYISGESHLYFGKRYRLKVIKADQENIKLKNGYFLIQTSDIAPQNIKDLMISWYRSKAKKQFKKSFERCWTGTFSQEYDPPKLQVKLLKKRWGSLSPNAILTLNLNLIMAPKECIDYVITHELCHLKYPNHSLEFYQLLEENIPNWKKVKHKLEVFMS